MIGDTLGLLGLVMVLLAAAALWSTVKVVPQGYEQYDMVLYFSTNPENKRLSLSFTYANMTDPKWANPKWVT